MTGAGVQIVGFTRIAEKLRKVSELDKKVEVVTLAVEREAKILCPVRTGRLRASIHTGRHGPLERYVGTNVEYAPYVEFGTRRMSAKPYLRPAVKKVVMRIKTKGISWWVG
ncbi:MAG: HK97 gp10 family phage protein [Bacillaceae bacterium]|nr:HK97 gp10 family phage protein [Bacillaceae bacterium]